MNLKQYTRLLDAMKALIDVVEIEKENMLREAPTAEEFEREEEVMCYWVDSSFCEDCNDDSCPHYKGE